MKLTICHKVNNLKIYYKVKYEDNMIIFEHKMNNKQKRYIIINLTYEDDGFVQVSIDGILMGYIQSDQPIEMYDKNYENKDGSDYYYGSNVTHNKIIRDLVMEYEENPEIHIMESLFDIAIRMCSSF
jgi:hypothetical protein